MCVFGLAFTFAATGARRRAGPAGHGAPPRPLSVPPKTTPEVELRVVSIAFDARARASLQRAFASLASQGEPSDPHSLYARACAVRDLLTGAHGAARYGAFQSIGSDLAGAEARFAALADRARGRYTVETINNTRRTLDPTLHAKPEEGDGLVVCTILVAARGVLPDLPSAVDLPGMMNALQNVVPARSDRLLALEAIWSPAADADRMSSAELEVLYPELLRLDPRASFGRAACGSCRAVFARELGRCPACGAPTRAPA